MKLLRRAALGLAVVLALATAPGPAQAAGPYTIVAHGTVPFTATGAAWLTSKCSPTVLNGPANGIESRIIDASAFAGRVVRVTWKSAASAAGVATGIYGQPKAYNSACAATSLGSFDWSLSSSTMTVGIPAGTRWVQFDAFGSANISFTVV